MPMNPSIAERRIFDGPGTVDEVVVVRDAMQRPAVALIGRFLIAAVFLLSGIGKLTDLPGTATQLDQHGLPYAPTLALIAGIAEVAGAVGLILGVLTRAASVGLILFMIPATLIFHAFWNFHGAERLPQQINFVKNLAIIGGLMVLAAFGAGRSSVDYLVRRTRHRS